MNYADTLRLQTDNRLLMLCASALTLILGVMFAVGTLGMALQLLRKEYLWTTSVYLGVQAALTFALLWNSSSFSRAALITIGIGMAAAALEFVGLATGIPFGTYYYSYRLEPFVVSNVPLAIIFAWYILVVNIVLVSLPLTRSGKPGSSTWAAIAAGAVFILGIDIMLEPFASFVNRYWTWSGGVIPMQNYASWFAFGAIFIALTHAALGTQEMPRRASLTQRVTRIPELILGATILQCTIINVLNGYVLPTAVGMLLCAGAYWRLRYGTI